MCSNGNEYVSGLSVWFHRDCPDEVERLTWFRFVPVVGLHPLRSGRTCGMAAHEMLQCRALSELQSRLSFMFISHAEAEWA